MSIVVGPAILIQQPMFIVPGGGGGNTGAYFEANIGAGYNWQGLGGIQAGNG